LAYRPWIYPSAFLQGIKTRLCEHTVPDNQYLAGLKHLNRLDQVIARNEWSQTDIVEGLMFDQAGHLVEGIMSNIFAVKDNMLFTPVLDRCGVEGVMKNYIGNVACRELAITLLSQPFDFSINEVDELFICNSVFGVWPVVEIVDYCRFNVGDITKDIQNFILDLGYAELYS
jgi:4-amino-4-deoxychorismate lyase